MTDEHDTKTGRLVIHLRNRQTRSVDGDISLFDYIRHLNGIDEFEVVSYRITIWLFGDDGRCCIYMALMVSGAVSSPRVDLLGPYVLRNVYVQPLPFRNSLYPLLPTCLPCQPSTNESSLFRKSLPRFVRDRVSGASPTSNVPFPESKTVTVKQVPLTHIESPT